MSDEFRKERQSLFYHSADPARLLLVFSPSKQTPVLFGKVSRIKLGGGVEAWEDKSCKVGELGA